MRRLSLVLVVPSLFGCADELFDHGNNTPTITDMKAKAPDVENGFQLKIPPSIIEVGQDVQNCYVPDFPVDADIFVKRADAYQGDVGHHVQLFASAVPRETGAFFDCTNASAMAAMLPLITPNHPLVETDDSKQLPDNMYLRIPADTQIVLQFHYVNYTDNPIEVADVVNFETVTAEDVVDMIEANFYVVSHNAVEVPQGESRTTYECDVDAGTQLLYMMGHMHEQGAAFQVLRRPAGSDVDELIYEVGAWTSAMRDDAPTETFPTSDPFVFNAGDHITMHCDYDNQTGKDLSWPKEMCVLFTAYYPARDGGFLTCD